MQKLLRRTAQAKVQAARKIEIQRSKRRSENRKLRNNEEHVRSQEVRANVLAARTARRQDWLLGPLAPRRDVGEKKETYGAISGRQLRGMDKPKEERRKWRIVSGDRVVVVEEGHRERGKIGKVQEVRKEAQECVVEGLNLVDVAIPAYMQMGQSDKRPVATVARPIPLSSVRLVHPLPDPRTGGLRDVVIKELEFKYGRRYIAGLTPRIWIPTPPRNRGVELEDHDIDTLRIDVEKRTWVPTLLHEPMPGSVIDELRNKYSKFRDRHDRDYLEKLEKEDEKAVEKKRWGELSMMTPLQEMHAKRQAERQAKGAPELGPEMLARIGEVMARNKKEVMEKDKTVIQQM